MVIRPLFENWMEYEEQLKILQRKFCKLKRIKLEKRFEKYGNHLQYSFFQVFEHLRDELIELSDAIESGNPDAIKDELSDVSNCLDMMFDILDKKGIGDWGKK